MFGRHKYPVIETERLILRLPLMGDYVDWASLRRDSADFLDPWEPVRNYDYLSRKSYRYRIAWARQMVREKSALPLTLIRRSDGALLGGITLDNMQGGVAQYCTVGYWMGKAYAHQGYMSEALSASVDYAFNQLDLSRIQAGCLEENAISRRLLEKSGFKYEGVAQAYLLIAGRWRDHVIYAKLRHDRRGRSAEAL